MIFNQIKVEPVEWFQKLTDRASEKKETSLIQSNDPSID